MPFAQKAISGNDIKNGTEVVLTTGKVRRSIIQTDDSFVKTGLITDLLPLDERFDDPRYYTGDTAS